MPAIKIEGLSKKYIIGHQKQERYTALRDVMMHKMRGLGQRLRHPLSPNQEEVDVEEFWALKDINLEIQQGDRVGIIGRNGAGKSTLLKVLSRITEPTNGKIHLNGRVASLLEVGTGFHPELSGRENIYLNGAILGMGRDEIKRKFDEIVGFSGVEKFLDTPVKRYSSGMYVRLAFAVAAHLEPEILIVDEVLAVGDAEFQKKCLGKMEEVGKEGRTVLFVSHNMGAIRSLCSNAVLMHKGSVSGYGNVEDQINSYLSTPLSNKVVDSSSNIMVGKDLKLNKFHFSPNPIESGKTLKFEIELSTNSQATVESIVILIFSSLNERVGVLDLRKASFYKLQKGKGLLIQGEVSRFSLVDGKYSIGLYVKAEGEQVTKEELVTIDVVQSNENINGVSPYSQNVRGLVEFELTFGAGINDI